MTTSLDHDSRHLAETYDRMSDLQFAGGKRLVERLDIAHGARVLDIGCGTGRLAQWMLERVGPSGSVIGIDPLAERIAIARSHGSAARFEVGQAEDLRAFDDATFDAVVMSSVFHWVSGKAEALAELRRVLQPGGRLGLTTIPNELSRVGTVSLTLRPLLQRAPYAGHVDHSALGNGRRCTSTDLVNLVLDSGMEIVDLHVTQHTSQHESGEAFLDFAESSSFGNLLRLVPEHLRPSLRKDLIEAFDAQRTSEGVAVRGWSAMVVAMRP
jgi:ubiquinone/menaquinone biosynthesis C-methylase UbiE